MRPKLFVALMTALAALTAVAAWVVIVFQYLETSTQAREALRK